jgi:hypothetical protein
MWKERVSIKSNFRLEGKKKSRKQFLARTFLMRNLLACTQTRVSVPSSRAQIKSGWNKGEIESENALIESPQSNWLPTGRVDEDYFTEAGI